MTHISSLTCSSYTHTFSETPDMPDPPSVASGGAPPTAAVERVAQLKPPGKLDFDSASLSSSWKRWKEEVELYMDLAMAGKDKKNENQAVSLPHWK